MEYQDLLNVISKEYSEILKENLVGIYVHGSIAFGCFNPEKSDIDFLVVVNNSLTPGVKEQLIATLLRLDDSCPQKGFEMSVVLKKYCMEFIYPTPYELHFSNGYKELCKTKDGLKRHCACKDLTDKDLAAHFTVTREAGITLFGEDKASVFGPVPKDHYLDSIRYDIENASEDIIKDPTYIILNLCRVLAYTRERLVLSKKGGGEWGLRQKDMPEEYLGVVSNALGCYTGGFDVNIADTVLKGFADYMLKLIDKG